MKVKPQKCVLGLRSFINDMSNFSLSQTLVFCFGFFFFKVWTTFLKYLLNLLQYCFCCLCVLFFVFFGPEACGILTP